MALCLTYKKHFQKLFTSLFKIKHRINPGDLAVIQHEMMQLPAPTMVNSKNDVKVITNSNQLTDNTTITKHILMNRFPEIYSRDDT